MCGLEISTSSDAGARSMVPSLLQRMLIQTASDDIPLSQEDVEFAKLCKSGAGVNVRSSMKLVLQYCSVTPSFSLASSVMAACSSDPASITTVGHQWQTPKP